MAIKYNSMSESRSVSSNSDCSDVSGPDKDVEKSVPSDQSSCDKSSVAEKSEHHLRVLSNCQRLSYGVGHVLNDLTASMWFSYLLLFFQKVNKFENVLAGDLMLIGQVSDAIFTPFIGYESDRTRGIRRIGKRKSWHLVGTLCVMASFPFLFTKCIKCSHAPSSAQFVYYAPFVVIFQFGWAATQISHLSFSSDFTPHKHERVTLQSIRNMFTVVANLSVYGIFALLFYLEGRVTDENLAPSDAPKFQTLALICIGMGTVFNFIFHLGTKEKSDGRWAQDSARVYTGENSIERSTLLHSRMTWKDWLKDHQFYQIAVLYMATRLYINISQVFFPMYLVDTLYFDKKSIALLPLVTYCSSFLMSFAASYVNRILGRKESGAFVFGAMSFTDKLSNGVAVLLIEKFHPCVGCCPACEPYYRSIQVFVPGGALIIGFIALLTLIPQNIGSRARAVDVLKVLENPARETNQGSLTDSLQCSCGSLLSSSGTCSNCSAPPRTQANGSITHNAEVHRSYDTNEDDEDDSDEDNQDDERRPFLHASINTPTRDVQFVTEYGSLNLPNGKP